MTPQELVTLIGALVAVFVSVGSFFLSRRKAESSGSLDYANASNAIAEGAERMIKEYKEQISAMRLELADVRSDLDILQAGVMILIDQLSKAGLKPAWQPDKKRRTPKK